MRTRQITVAAGIAASLLLAVGCSSSGGDATATSTTAVVEMRSGGGGGDDPGTVDDDAGGSDDTDPVALPDDWPDELALPDDVVVLEASGGRSMVVVARVDGDPKTTLDELEDNLTAADWNIESSDFTESAQGGYGGIAGQNRQMTVAISLGPDPTGDTTEITILLAEKTSA